MHADFIEYKPVKKEIADAEEADLKLVHEDDLVVLFTAFERGDDEELVKRAISDAKDFLGKLGAARVMLYPFAHISQDLARPKDALKLLVFMEAESKAAGLTTMKSPFGWTKALQIKVKGHPLAEMSRSYTHQPGPDTFPPAKPRREQTDSEIQSRLKRSDFSGLPETDHRVIGEKLDLFSFQETSPGMVYWHDRGLKIWNALIDLIRREEAKQGYIELSTPSLANSALWKVSGHWDFYKENMFVTEMGDEEFALKPMNCPSTMLYYRSKKWSFRDLPLRVACFDTLHRNELSGVASGLFRVKKLTQDDAHIFVTKEQAPAIIGELLDLMMKMYHLFNFEFEVRVSTMPDEHAGAKDEWDEATTTLEKVLSSKGLKYTIMEKDGTFYGPKIDVDIKDSMGRKWQCTTIQLDYQLPKRFNLTYTGSDGKEHETITVHRAIFGTLERFIGVLLEHYKGRLPVWLSPVQARVVPLTGANRDYAGKILTSLIDSGIRAEGDFESGTLNAKVRNAQILQVPYVIVVGGKEESAGTISVRTREGKQEFGVSAEAFLAGFKEKVASFQ